MTTNQRQHERVRAPRIQVRVASLDRLRAFYLDDLSQGGIFIRTDKPLAMGAIVDIDLIPPDMPVVPLRGAVVRTLMDETARAEKRAGMAIRFEGLSKEAEQALAALIARLRQPAPAPAPPAPVTASAPENPQRIAALEMELADLKGKVEAYEQQNRQLQDDEETARHLAEHIAQEKSDLAQQFDKLREKSSAEGSRAREESAQAQRHAEELELQADTLEQTLATVETALDTERREHENTTAELTAVRSKGGS
jgi:DNA repair exonuclease SbcCD ATPase subunit